MFQLKLYSLKRNYMKIKRKDKRGDTQYKLILYCNISCQIILKFLDYLYDMFIKCQHLY